MHLQIAYFEMSLFVAQRYNVCHAWQLHFILNLLQYTLWLSTLLKLNCVLNAVSLNSVMHEIWYFHRDDDKEYCFLQSCILLFSSDFSCKDYVASMIISDHEFGALVKWHWQGKLKYLKESLSIFHFVHHRLHVDWLGIERGFPQWEAGN